MNCEMWLSQYSKAGRSESSIGLSKFKSSKWKCVSVLLEERKLRCFSAGAGRREKAMRSSSFRGSRPIWFVVGRVWGGEVGNAHVMEVLRFGSSLAESGVEKLAACDVLLEWCWTGVVGYGEEGCVCMFLSTKRDVDLNHHIEYIPEQPDWTTYRDPTPASPPPSVDEYSPGNTQSVPFVPCGGTSSSRGSKRKAPLVDVVDAHFSALRSSLDGFTDALTSSNVHLGVISNAAVEQVSTMKDRNEILRSQTEILRRTSNYPYTEADIYDMLSGMQISDETLFEQCYDFLCANPTCVKRLMGLPPHKRWNKLCKMFAGGN
ncbi:uncharacterized protein HKW66_Vig0021910 [Vigna angularis]|uniref:Uncharacterized protein n=1 Tax=Phaseolus angularis TaxID=3914 RepID=A0A8T0L652_PHAAN|nr:uncharacterized protein HKW66_Vig0021910 [Vigna angularis]